jgi:hypothetical protein
MSMTSTPSDAASLREKAARCFRLAKRTKERRTAEALEELGRDLLAQAAELDAKIENVLREIKGEPETPT